MSYLLNTDDLEQLEPHLGVDGFVLLTIPFDFRKQAGRVGRAKRQIREARRRVWMEQFGKRVPPRPLSYSPSPVMRPMTCRSPRARRRVIRSRARSRSPGRLPRPDDQPPLARPAGALACPEASGDAAAGSALGGPGFVPYLYVLLRLGVIDRAELRGWLALHGAVIRAIEPPLDTGSGVPDRLIERLLRGGQRMTRVARHGGPRARRPARIAPAVT